MGQLSNLFVVDLTRNVAGPLCTMYLADLGAEVIKVEHPDGGDAARYHGPPFINGESSYYLSLNRNKKSLTLDLKTATGKEVLQRLLSRADVLINNFRPGVMERLGFDYETVHKEYPSLIYCNITGFGADGPWAKRHAYDHIMQGFSGLMSVTGSEQAGNFRVGVSIGDVVTGLHALYGILSALYKRNETGQGNCVDTSLLESMVSCLTFQAGHYFATGEAPQANGNDHPMISPYGTFRTKDGMINICAGNDAMFSRLCEALNRSDLTVDPRFRSNPDRVGNRTQLTKELENEMSAHETQFWVEHLSQSGVACGPLNNIADIFSHPQVLHRKMLMEIDHPTAGKIKSTGFPVKFSSEGPTLRNAPPALGDYTQPILQQLGFNKETIEKWMAQGEVGDARNLNPKVGNTKSEEMG
jgi:crotonobetainyl-CoA:carnitine CoA-transferase CaiB-like acyl-CoA transferase